MIKTVWVLTSEVNAYDQCGEYFEFVFLNKPTLEQLKILLQCTPEYAEHIANGGGRVWGEDSWYNLREVEVL